jgi:predicted dehydrogenase
MPKTKTPKTKAAPKSVPATPNTYGGPVASSVGEPLRVALVGAGGIAATHYRGYVAAKANVMAFVEPYDITRAAREKEWGIKGYETLEALLANESIEAVSVCSPNAFHHGVTVAAAQAGLHVLCEKPLSMSLAECQQMIDAAKKAKVVLQTGHHLRSNLLVEKTKELIDSGQIGKVTFMRLRQAHDWGGNKAVRESFGLLKNSGGGTLLDNGCHMMDLARHLGGDVRRVSGMMGTLGTWATKVEVEDTSVVQLEFANGILGSVENAWTATGWEEGWWIYGTEGAVECTNRLGKRMVRHVRRDSSGTTWDKVDETIYSYADEGGHPRQIVNFIRSIRDGAPVICTGHDGMESVRLVLTAYESAKKGKPVSL